jgi:hypothetical protein
MGIRTAGRLPLAKLFFILMIYAWPLAAAQAQEWRKDRLIFRDNFWGSLDNWIVETPPSPHAKVSKQKGELVMDVNGGATVWLNKKLSGNILIEYKRRVVMQGGVNDRLSDLNQFWMASDPDKADLFTRSGVFAEYDGLRMYYVGFGGNYNTTTRFRKYTGTGERVLLQEVTEPAFLLQANKEYRIRIVVYQGHTYFYVDGRQVFSFADPDPLREGYFGFRTTQSHHRIDDFRVYRLK